MNVSSPLDGYQNTMYEHSLPPELRTGDVIRLVLDDFRAIVRHEAIIPVFQQFDSVAAYSSKLWVILNQPCDMVHDPERQRYFKSNLFIAPLIGFRTALKRNAFGKLLHYERLPEPTQVFISSFKSYFLEKTRRENVLSEGETPKAYGARVAEIARPAINKITELVGGAEFEDPQEVLSALRELFLQEAEGFLPLLDDFAASESWMEALGKYVKEKDEAEKKNEAVILNSGAAKSETLAKLCQNQLDSKGVFFFEPNQNISTIETDLAFVFQLQDMLTIKIKSEVQQSGFLFKLLKENRKVSLTENFSDRLLNIMGNYFSKIGTDDVLVNMVLELYTKAYPSSFFTTHEQFKDFQMKQARPAPAPTEPAQ